MNRLATVILATLLLAIAMIASCIAGMRDDIRFHLAMRAGSNEVDLAFDRVGRGHDHMRNSLPITHLRGLSPAILRSPAMGNIEFTIERAPGPVACHGVAIQDSANGRCDFTRNAAYDAALAHARYAQLDDDQQFALTIADFDPARVNALITEAVERLLATTTPSSASSRYLLTMPVNAAPGHRPTSPPTRWFAPSFPVRP